MGPEMNPRSTGLEPYAEQRGTGSRGTEKNRPELSKAEGAFSKAAL